MGALIGQHASIHIDGKWEKLGWIVPDQDGSRAPSAYLAEGAQTALGARNVTVIVAIA